MLLATIGALWIISIICLMFLGAYTYHLTKQHLQEQSGSYFWTVTRLVILLFLSLALFYFGVARQIAQLPRLVAYELSLRHVPVWSADDWALLSLLFGILGAVVALLDTIWNDWELLPKPEVRWLSVHFSQLSLNVPYALTTSAAPAALMTDQEVDRLFVTHQDRMWSLASALLGLFAGCFLFVGLQAVSQLNFVQALGIPTETQLSLAAGQRIRPTPTALPESAADALLGLKPADGTTTQTDLTAPQTEAVGERSRAETDLLPLSAAGENRAETPADDGPEPEPVPVDSTLSVDGASPDINAPQSALEDEGTSVQASPRVMIEEPLGVNARSGPDITFEVLTILETGTELEIVGWSEDDQWIQVRLPGQATGWVASWVVVVEES